MVIHFPTSKGVSEVSERVSAVECASGAEQANERVVRANERTDEQVAHYFSLYSWLFWPTVQWRGTLQW